MSSRRLSTPSNTPQSLGLRCRFVCHTPPNTVPPRLPHPHRSSMKALPSEKNDEEKPRSLAMNAASTKAGYRMLSNARLRFVDDLDGSMNNGEEYFYSNPFFHSFTHYLVPRTVCIAIRFRAPISPERSITVTSMQVRII